MREMKSPARSWPLASKIKFQLNMQKGEPTAVAAFSIGSERAENKPRRSEKRRSARDALCQLLLVDPEGQAFTKNLSGQGVQEGSLRTRKRVWQCSLAEN